MYRGVKVKVVLDARKCDGIVENVATCLSTRNSYFERSTSSRLTAYKELELSNKYTRSVARKKGGKRRKNAFLKYIKFPSLL